MPQNGWYVEVYNPEYYKKMYKLKKEFTAFYLSRGVGQFKAEHAAEKKARKIVDKL